jgi:methyl-accepting chemotaxis protein
VGYQVIRVERQLAELKDLMQSTLDTKLNAIKQSYAEVVKKVEESSSMIAEQNSVSIESYKSIKQQTDLIAEHTMQQRDREEREFRERNLIIFGIPE